MFEKEAHEFQKQIQQEYLDLGKNGAYPPLWERIGELWGKGAEFGYNKGKEEVKAPYPSYKHLFGESIEQTALRYSNDLINSLRVNIDYAKAVIQDLLDNSDEYVRQRAINYLKEEEK